MKRMLFFTSLLVLAVMQAVAANVDLAMAQATAQRFIDRHDNGKRLSSAPADIRLLHAETNSSLTNVPVYYIFNTDNSFVIVAGDDRAQEILAHGDRPLDMNHMPANMKYWLSTYKRQIEFLQAHPGLVVEKPKASTSMRAHTIAPLLTAEWDQLEPYYNHCPVYNGEYCLTGCPATSLSMVFYYWKYPKDPTPEVESYTATSIGTRLPALPSITFDWDNMLDKYEGVEYTEAQADAVAWLMRYIGQVERMDYSPEGSGAQGEDILRAVKFFGYDEDAEVVYKATADYYGSETELINDADWAELIQTELSEGRPLVYCAYDYDSWYGWSGHAFNVDGYNAIDNTYHVNWGWSGEGNGDFALNAFTYGDYTFNVEQLIIKGLQPPITTPTIKVSPVQINMQALAEKTDVTTFTVKGKYLTDAVTLTLHDENGVFSLDASSVDVAETAEGKEITVTYAPLYSGTHNATITLSSPEAEDVIITLHGEAALETHDPVMLPADSAYVTLTQFRADWTDLTADKYVESYTLEVNTKPGAVLLDEVDWSEVTEMGTNYSDNPGAILPQGWTFAGNGLWREAGGISINNKSSFATPNYDLAGFEKVTVVVTAKSVLTSSNSRFTVSTSVDSKEFTANAGADFTRFVAVLNCEEIDQVTFAGKSNYPQFQSIQIYAGELDEPMLRAIAEEGDANYRIVTGLTDKHYLVTGLAAGGTFYYRVKAFYTDGTQSAWSKSKNVTLFGNGQDHQPGDVNHDGQINISDVTSLIDMLLGAGSEACETCADVDGDGNVNISDVTSLIDKLLSGN